MNTDFNCCKCNKNIQCQEDFFTLDKSLEKMSEGSIATVECNYLLLLCMNCLTSSNTRHKLNESINKSFDNWEPTEDMPCWECGKNIPESEQMYTLSTVIEHYDKNNFILCPTDAQHLLTLCMDCSNKESIKDKVNKAFEEAGLVEKIRKSR